MAAPSPPRIALAVALALGLTVVLLWVRAAVESHRDFDAGEAAQAAGDLPSAILHYRHAVQWHAPLGSTCEASLDALTAIGDAAAAQGDVELALFAWRSARAGVMATRHLWTPHVGHLTGLHERIGLAMARQIAGDAAPDPAEAARFTAQLDDWRARSPNPWLAAGASLGFIGWILALIMLARRGFDADGALVRAGLVRWGSAAAALFVAWVVMVRLA